MRLAQGRWLSDTEPTPVVVINESLARREFAQQDAIGKRLQIGGRPGGPDAVFATIIGVVADLKYSKLDVTPPPELFIDYAHGFVSTGGIMLVLRTIADPLEVAAPVRALISDIDKAQSVDQVKTLEQVLSNSIASRRFYLFLLGTFAATALLLAVLGVYGVTSYSAALRTREIGIRLALGARQGEVIRMVIGQGLGMVLAGLIVGFLAAIALTRLMVSVLYDVEPTDPLTLAAVAALLCATGFVACWGPARRLLRANPIVALRDE